LISLSFSSLTIADQSSQRLTGELYAEGLLFLLFVRSTVAAGTKAGFHTTGMPLAVTYLRSLWCDFPLRFQNFRKVGKFAAFIERPKTKSVSASWGLRP